MNRDWGVDVRGCHVLFSQRASEDRRFEHLSIAQEFGDFVLRSIKDWVRTSPTHPNRSFTRIESVVRC